jgi:aminopeptidase N
MVQIEAGLRAAGGYAQMRFIVAHETAHEWWHALVGNDPVREPWLDEALATYSVAVYAGDVDGPAAAQATVASFRAQAGGSDDITASALNYRTWAAYRGPVYYQGALFFHALRLDMGDDAFYAMLRQYVNEHRFGIATTRDLTAMAEQYAGRELDSLFIRWFGSPEPGT